MGEADRGRVRGGLAAQPRSSTRNAVRGTRKVRSPRTNGFVERMNRTLLDECFRVQGRTKWYKGPDQIQRNLDVFMAGLPRRRQNPCQGPLRPHRLPVAPATDFRRGPGGATRQLTRRHPEDRVSGKYSTCTGE